MTSSKWFGHGRGAAAIVLAWAGTQGLGMLGCSSGTPTENEEQIGEAKGAILPKMLFEAHDGNTKIDGLGHLDWANAPALTEKFDTPSGGLDDALGNGAKEDSLAPNKVSGGIPKNKSDLKLFRIAHEAAACPPPSVGKCAYLYLSWERYNKLGTANIDFELNQSTALSANGTTPVRTAGDLLITYDFQGGAPAIGILEWLTAATGGTCESNGGSPVGGCWGNRTTLAAPVAEGSISSDLLFGEAAVNLTSAGVVSGCLSFGRAFMKSRSSASFTAELKDFVAPMPIEVDMCEPWTIDVEKVDQAGDALVGVTFGLYRDVNLDGKLDVAVDPWVASCTTDAWGHCSFVVDSDPAASGKYIVRETGPLPGYSVAPDQYVQVKIDEVAQHVQLYFVNERLVGQVDIQKRDDADHPVQGIVFTLTGAAGTYSCTTGPSGDCSMSGVPVGEYTLDEVVNASSVYGRDPTLPRTVTVEHGTTITEYAVNPRKYRVVTIVCREGTNDLAPSMVTLGGQSFQSLGAVPASLLGVTASDLCGLDGARFERLPEGTHGGQVVLD